LGSRPNELPDSISFGDDFQLDVRAYELRSAGVALKLKPIPMELLLLLIEHRGELVTREQIVERIWGKGVFLDTDNSINAAVSRIRQVLRDDAEQPRFVQTVTGKGYRFIAPVENGALHASAAVAQQLAPVRPRRPTPQLWYKGRFVIAAGVAALLLVATFSAWRAFHARPALTGTDVILLTTFVNKTGDPIFDNSLDKALEIKLTESPFLSLLSEADVRRTMTTMRHDPNEKVTEELGIEICKRQGLRAVVVPEIAAFGKSYLITLDAIDAQNQKSIARQQEEAESKEKVVAALGKAASQLRAHLGESLTSLEKHNVPLDLATTSSLEALQAYRTGQTLYRSGKRRESIALFERAVELDPQFCSAYSMLGSAYHSIDDTQASKKNFARAFELKDRRLTQEENFQTTALYHSAITGNLEKETAVLVLYKQAYPRSAFAHNLLGIAYAGLGRTEEALQEFYWAMDDSPAPSAQHYSNASQSLMILGRFDEARKILDQWQQKGSLTPFQIVLRYELAFVENDTATMERLAREVAGDDVTWLRLQMDLAFSRGDFKKIRSLSEALVQQQVRAKRMENASFELDKRAWDESYVGNYALARQLCRQAGGENQNDAFGLGLCAEALGNAGDLPQAEALAAKLDLLYPEDTSQQRLYLPLIRSIIQRQKGDTAKAVALLAPVTQYPNGLVFLHRGLAYLAAGENRTAAEEFRKVISHPGWPQWGVFAPLAQLGLARAYARQGDREESRKAYDDFFTTWKDADPDIPILRQAKDEYKKLTASASAAASA
jgi:eukaryotic-like serine/threonine-protein kinase